MNKLQNNAVFLLNLSIAGIVIFLLALLLTGCGAAVNAQEAREAPSLRVLQYDNGNLVAEIHIRDDASAFPHVTHYMSLDVGVNGRCRVWGNGAGGMEEPSP